MKKPYLDPFNASSYPHHPSAGEPGTDHGLDLDDRGVSSGQVGTDGTLHTDHIPEETEVSYPVETSPHPALMQK